jgi:hypothetical protein
MERAHIYRSVSAPAALIGGVLSLAVATYDFELSGTWGEHLYVKFLLSWLAVLVVTGGLNLYLLTREGRSKGDPIISESFRMAFRALLPPLISGGILGCGMIRGEAVVILGVLIWVICYGLALQATVSFAPRSIIHLARAFLITGQVLAAALLLLGNFPNDVPQWLIPRMDSHFSLRIASVIMGLTFGLYHLIYAVAVFVSRPQTTEQADRFIEAP